MNLFQPADQRILDDPLKHLLVLSEIRTRLFDALTILELAPANYLPNKKCVAKFERVLDLLGELFDTVTSMEVK